jgi:glycosyltransferase involved in cell wall biosynthesis
MKIRILFCIDTLSGGGAEKVLIDVLKVFDYNKYMVHLLILDNYGVYFNEIPTQVNWFTLENIKHNLNTGYDIGIAFLEGRATKYISQNKNISKKIAWVHINLLDNHWSKAFFKDVKEEQECYSRIDQIIFVSYDAQKMFNKLFRGLDVTKQTVIYNLIDKKSINEKKSEIIAKRKLTLCTVGRLIQQKGYLRLIPILHRLQKEDKLDFDFWFVGDGYQKEELKNLASIYNINDNITFWGFCKNPYSFMNTADVFISSSFTEGLPLVIAEALCLGKPIVATDVTGSAELLGDGEYGLLVKPDDESLYKGIKEIVINKSLRESLSEKSTKRSKIFDAEKTMNQIYNLLRYVQ